MQFVLGLRCLGGRIGPERWGEHPRVSVRGKSSIIHSANGQVSPAVDVRLRSLNIMDVPVMPGHARSAPVSNANVLPHFSMHRCLVGRRCMSWHISSGSRRRSCGRSRRSNPARNRKPVTGFVIGPVPANTVTCRS
jgi:hypothetical protein